jgi:nucleoside-diphosphate-sugar epimerase
MKGADGVVHLAALIDVEASVRDPFQTHDVNANGTLNLLHEAVKAGVKRLVFASSTAVCARNGSSLKNNKRENLICLLVSCFICIS